MSSIAVIYGWSEGPWQAKKFRQEAFKQGFTGVSNLIEADVLVAHSSGCFLVPKNNKAKVVLLIGPPIWPGRNLITAVAANLKADFGLHKHGKTLTWWLTKLLHNSWYIVRRPTASWYVITKHRLNNLPEPSSGQSVYFIRNSHDTFCKPNAQELVPQAKFYKILVLPGSHDDCWFRPAPYVELIKKELE